MEEESEKIEKEKEKYLFKFYMGLMKSNMMSAVYCEFNWMQVIRWLFKDNNQTYGSNILRNILNIVKSNFDIYIVYFDYKLAIIYLGLSTRIA